MFKKFLKKIKNAIVQDTPPSLVACEFECHKQSCTQAELDTCVNRHMYEITENTKKQIYVGDFHFDAIQDDEY
jgi:hypothetical protein